MCLARACDSSSAGIGAAWLALMAAGVVDTPFGPGERYCGNVLVATLLGASVVSLATARRKALDRESQVDKVGLA
jgi:hypothetical protein